MRTSFLGDIHGDYSVLDTVDSDLIIQVGDFGYFPKLKKVKTIKNVQFIDGNHEDHWALLKDPLQLPHNVEFIPRMTQRYINGYNVLYIGGAFSIDKEYRTFGFDWYPEELVTYRDVTQPVHNSVDIVVSHTAPREFVKKLPIIEIFDSSSECLSYILHTYEPKFWVFGHFHLSKRGEDFGCKWQCLNCNEVLDFECLVSA